MSSRAQARPIHRRTRKRLAGASLMVAAIVAVILHESPPSSTTTPAPDPVAASRVAPPRQHGDPLGVAGGAVPDGTTVFGDAVPGVARLEPALLGALRRAAGDAQADGIDFEVDSGWRSAAYQEHLLRDAVAKYGSVEEAARWVATPRTSAHVSGDAIDVGPSRAREWLAAEGAVYGLCPVYDNEPWHYELRPDAARSGCPPTYPDPTHDPRMQP